MRRAAHAYGRARASLIHDAWLVTGKERVSGEPLVLLFSGNPRNRNYLTHLIFEGECREQRLRVPRWNAEELPFNQRIGHALAITEQARWPEVMPPGTFYIPCWIGGEIEFAVAERLRKTSGQVGADLRRIRKQGYVFSVERGVDWLWYFYDHMCCPYLRNVYESRAFFVSRAEVEAKAPQAELVLVHANGEPVAGQIMLYENGGVRGWMIGVKDGDREHVRRGAIAAIYHFTTRYLANKGFDKIHAGASRPFLSDGVLRYKAKWGMRLTDATPKWFALTLGRLTNAAMAFLSRNPFVYQQAGRLFVAEFAEGEYFQPSERAFAGANLAGIAGTTVFRRVRLGTENYGWTLAALR